MSEMSPLAAFWTLILSILTLTSCQASTCGIENVSPRIINGRTSTPYHFPWIVFIAVRPPDSPAFNCTGSVIGDRWILTAGHCVFPREDASSTKVYVRQECLRTTLNYGLDIKRVIRHEKYGPVPQGNDIGIIELVEPLTFSRQLMPVCLPQKTHKYDNFVIAGWGMEFDGVKRVNAECLNEADLDVTSDSECRREYEGYDHSRIMCAAGVTNICRGDSGAPLMSRMDGLVVQAGIASFARTDCGIATQSPAGFERIAPHVDWIKKHTNGGVCLV